MENKTPTNITTRISEPLTTTEPLVPQYKDTQPLSLPVSGELPDTEDPLSSRKISGYDYEGAKSRYNRLLPESEMYDFDSLSLSLNAYSGLDTLMKDAVERLQSNQDAIEKDRTNPVLYANDARDLVNLATRFLQYAAANEKVREYCMGEAKRLFTDALKTCKDGFASNTYAKYSAELYYQLGRAEFGLSAFTHQPQKAEKQYQQAVLLNPASVEYTLSLSYIQRQQGKIEEALETYEKSLRYNPANFELHQGKAEMLERLGDPDGTGEHVVGYRWEEALAAYDRAIIFAPEKIELYQAQVTILEKLMRTFKSFPEGIDEMYTRKYYGLLKQVADMQEGKIPVKDTGLMEKVLQHMQKDLLQKVEDIDTSLVSSRQQFAEEERASQSFEQVILNPLDLALIQESVSDVKQIINQKLQANNQISHAELAYLAAYFVKYHYAEDPALGGPGKEDKAMSEVLKAFSIRHKLVQGTRIETLLNNTVELYSYIIFQDDALPEGTVCTSVEKFPIPDLTSRKIPNFTSFMQKGGFANVEEYPTVWEQTQAVWQRARDLISYTQEHLPPLISMYWTDFKKSISLEYWNLQGVMYCLTHRVVSEDQLPKALRSSQDPLSAKDLHESPTEPITISSENTDVNLENTQVGLTKRIANSFEVSYEHNIQNIEALFSHKAYESIVALIKKYKDTGRINQALDIQEKFFACLDQDNDVKENPIFYKGLLRQAYLLSGDISYQLGQYEEAILSYRDCLKIRKEIEGPQVVDEYITTKIVRALMLNGQEPEAYGMYKKMIEERYFAQNNGLFQHHLNQTNKELHESKIPFGVDILMNYIRASEEEKKRLLKRLFNKDSKLRANFIHYATLYREAMNHFKEVVLPGEISRSLSNLTSQEGPEKLAVA